MRLACHKCGAEFPEAVVHHCPTRSTYVSDSPLMDRIAAEDGLTAPTPAGSARDVEALAEQLHRKLGVRENAALYARAVLASDWLAAHTARALAADRERLARVEALVAGEPFGESQPWVRKSEVRAALTAPHDEREAFRVVQRDDQGYPTEVEWIHPDDLGWRTP